MGAKMAVGKITGNVVMYDAIHGRPKNCPQAHLNCCCMFPSHAIKYTRPRSSNIERQVIGIARIESVSINIT
jgi:hypothetical protein